MFFDPYVTVFGESELGLPIERVKLIEQELAGSDCVLIITNHSQIDYEQVVSAARVVVDTRNATRDVKTGREKIVLI